MNALAPIHRHRPNDPTIPWRHWSGSNFGGAQAEKTPMQVLLRARETESDDDDQPADEAEDDVAYEPVARRLFSLRCFACAGTGVLWITDAVCPVGRSVRCVACHGTGRVEVKQRY